jgi:hypothetical protein
VHCYMSGFEKKEIAHNLFTCLLQKSKAEYRLAENLKYESRVKEGIIKDMTQVIEKLNQELIIRKK